MAYYWRGKLPLTSDLVTDFFRFASDDLRGRALESVGRWLADRPATSPVPAEALARLRALWEWRVQVARESPDPMTYQGELSRFGLWFASRKFDEAWSLAQLRTVLDLVKLIRPEFKVAEALDALAARFPLEAVQCARLIAQSDRQGWETYASDKHFKAIITAAITSGDGAARAAADGLIQFFVGRGAFDYRTLLP